MWRWAYVGVGVCGDGWVYVGVGVCGGGCMWRWVYVGVGACKLTLLHLLPLFSPPLPPSLPPSTGHTQHGSWL